jgi:hypothetical protein
MLEIRTEVIVKAQAQVVWPPLSGSKAELIVWKEVGTRTLALVRPEGVVYEPVRFVAQRREVLGGKNLLDAERREGAPLTSSLALPIFVGTWRNNLYFRCVSTADACQQ